MRWYIIRTLLYKEWLRHLADRGGFFLAVRHLGKFGQDVSDALLAFDRARMTPAEREASIRSEKTYRRRFSRFALPRLAKVLSPFYNPVRRAPPRGAEQFLLQYE